MREIFEVFEVSGVFEVLGVGHHCMSVLSAPWASGYDSILGQVYLRVTFNRLSVCEREEISRHRHLGHDSELWSRWDSIMRMTSIPHSTRISLHCAAMRPTTDYANKSEYKRTFHMIISFSTCDYVRLACVNECEFWQPCSDVTRNSLRKRKRMLRKVWNVWRCMLNMCHVTCVIGMSCGHMKELSSYEKNHICKPKWTNGSHVELNESCVINLHAEINESCVKKWIM